jgi:hypothetical protein
MSAGPGSFPVIAIRLVEPSFVLRRRPIFGDAHCLGTVLVERLLLASPCPSDALRMFVFAHASLPCLTTNPPTPNPFRMRRFI